MMMKVEIEQIENGYIVEVDPDTFFSTSKSYWTKDYPAAVSLAKQWLDEQLADWEKGV